jgi:hypothetical protein
VKTATTEIEDKVDQLLLVLEKDTQQMRKSLSRLNEFRSLVVKHDDAGLGKLLENIQSESGSYKCNELKRRSIRKELAIILGCSPKQITLSRLEAELAGEKKAQIAERKAMLRSLADQLKKEHLSTSLLLSDCARFNSVLLKSVLEFGQAGTITYSPKGSAKRQANSAFMNFQF